MKQTFKELFHEFRRRKVLQGISIYVVAGWILIQVAATTFPFLNLPDWTVTTVIVSLIMGFPIAFLLSWKYKMVADQDGWLPEVMTVPPPPQRLMASTLLSFWTLFGITGILAVSLGLKALHAHNNSLTGEYSSGFSVDKDRVAVLIFENRTGKEELDIVGYMVSDWLTEGFISTGEAKVVSAATIKQHMDLAGFFPGKPDVVTSFRDVTGANALISGSYYLQGDSTLILRSSISRADNGEVLASFPSIEGPVDDPLRTVEKLKQKVLGFWMTKDDLLFEESPPSYNAYRYLLEAISNWDDDEKALRLLDKALELDSLFFRAKILKASVFYNTSDYPSLKETVVDLESADNFLNGAQRNNLVHFRALLDGDNLTAFRMTLRELEIHPEDPFIGTSAAIEALEMVDQPEKCLQIIEKIPREGKQFTDCAYCAEILNTKARALMRLGRYAEALEVFDQSPALDQTQTVLGIRIRALCQMSRFQEVQELLDRYNTMDPEDENRYLYYFACKEAKLAGNDVYTQKWGKEGLKRYSPPAKPSKLMTTRLQMLLGYFDEAEQIYLDAWAGLPNSVTIPSNLGLIYAQRGDSAKSSEMIQKLELLEGPYSYGNCAYAISRIYAVSGNQEQALVYFETALRKGFRLGFNDGQQDIYLSQLLTKSNLNSIYSSLNFNKI